MVVSMAVQADQATRERFSPAPGHGEERAAGKPLPLENGDRLSRAEFERRYIARPDLKKAELIKGVVYIPSPVRAVSHAEPHAAILGWLVTYCASTPGVRAADNATVRLDLDNEPQPNALRRIVPAAGGRTMMSADDYIDGAPELIVEIAASSAAIDPPRRRRPPPSPRPPPAAIPAIMDRFGRAGARHDALTAPSD